jgi:nucleoid DNA-binding protein
MANEIPTNVSKRVFWRYVNLKIKRIIHHYHVFSVISILFEEMLKDLKQGKEIKIFNLGTLYLKETKPRLYHDVNKRQVVLSDKHKILKFRLTPKLKKRLSESLDIDKTFKDD